MNVQPPGKDIIRVGPFSLVVVDVLFDVYFFSVFQTEGVGVSFVGYFHYVPLTGTGQREEINIIEVTVKDAVM